MENAEDKYDRIIQQALASMNNVDAPASDYRNGLQRAVEKFQTELKKNGR